MVKWQYQVLLKAVCAACYLTSTTKTKKDITKHRKIHYQYNAQHSRRVNKIRGSFCLHLFTNENYPCLANSHKKKWDRLILQLKCHTKQFQATLCY